MPTTIRNNRFAKMNMFMCYFCLASMVYITSASEDLFVFLPFEQKSVIPPSCPPNEIYRFCFSNCSDCNRRGHCTFEKCKGGCDCAPRFFRVTPEGPCEPVANCPIPDCGENEVFRECGPVCERCTTFNCRVINCDHRCYCKEGYLRNGEVCIPAEECPKKQRCSRTEEWAESGLIEEYCLHEENATVSNETQEVPQCYCIEGYRRNSLGFCINETLCPNIQCLGNEEYYKCIPKCKTTCRNYGDPNCTEDENCYPGCFCPSGYVMNDLRLCVAVEECSFDIEHVFLREPFEDDEEDDSSVTGGSTSSVFSETTSAMNETETSSSDGTTSALDATQPSNESDSLEEECKASTIESSTSSEPDANDPVEKSNSKGEASKTETPKYESATASTTPEHTIADDGAFDNDDI